MISPGETIPNPSSKELPPNLSDKQIAAITVLRDSISDEIKVEREQGERDITVSLVAITQDGMLVHIVEKPSKPKEYFTVRSGLIDALVEGRPLDTEVLEYGTDAASRYRGSGTHITLADGSKISIPGIGDNKPPTFDQKALYRIGDDDRPLPFSSQSAIDNYLAALPPPPPPPPNPNFS